MVATESCRNETLSLSPPELHPVIWAERVEEDHIHGSASAPSPTSPLSRSRLVNVIETEILKRGEEDISEQRGVVLRIYCPCRGKRDRVSPFLPGLHWASCFLWHHSGSHCGWTEDPLLLCCSAVVYPHSNFYLLFQREVSFLLFLFYPKRNE